MRQTKIVRDLFKETILTLNDLIFPIFVEEKNKDYQLIATMPGIFRIPEQRLPYEIERIAKADLKSVILFGISHDIDETGSDTWKEYGLVARISKACKDAVPDILVISDTCFCEYTSHGH